MQAALQTRVLQPKTSPLMRVQPEHPPTATLSI